MRMSLANLVPAGLSPSMEHADVLLELAYLATAVDGRLDDKELASYEELARRLRGKVLSRAEIDGLLDRFGSNVQHAEISERLQTIAPTLPDELRALAVARGALEVSKATASAEILKARSRAVLVPLAGRRLGLRLPQDSEIIILQDPRSR